ncbi:MAG: NUDIX hydrolase, partial [Myxococcota bacterium]
MPHNPTVPPWTLEDDRELTQTRIFTLRERTARSTLQPDLEGRFVYLDSPDWINVIAITPEGALVFVEQFRHGTRETTLEIPGGMVDPGEDFATAGARELLEETGYTGDTPVLIGVVTPNPAIQSNRCGTVLIRNARR